MIDKEAHITHHAATMTESQPDEYHISEERLLKLAASEPKINPSDEEDAHLDSCSQCFKKLVKKAWMFYNMRDVDPDRR